MKIAVIGRGRVGSALGPILKRARHDVTYGVRDAGTAGDADDDIPARSVADAVAASDIVIAAIMWDGVDDFLENAGDMAGKILIDCINPYDFMGGLTRLIDAGTSTAKLIQSKTSATVVKTLNQVGSPVMENPGAYPVAPLQFVAADDEDAKATIIELLAGSGFDARDGGGLEQAADLEAMARIWIAQTFMHGMKPETSWALIERS